MIYDMIRVLLAAFLVGVVPGWYWTRCLCATADRAGRLTYSVALSIALVPAVALALVRLLGGGVTFTVAVVSPLVVLGTGIAAYLRFGPAKEPDEPLATPPAPPGALALVPIVLGLALVLGSDLKDFQLFWLSGSCWGWPTEICEMSGGAQEFMLPVALLLIAAGVLHLLVSSRELESPVRLPEPQPSGRPRSPAVVLASRFALPAVLLLVLARGYLGPAIHDWPYIRGLDLYSHAVMTNLMMSRGEIEPYLIYPPGFHTLTALISRFSGLDPLEIFPLLAPMLLLLPTLASYTLARRLWGWPYGVVAALFSGVLLGGTYYYYNDAMYPNLVASQFLLVLAVGALFGLYASPSLRTGIVLGLVGSAVVLYHQVASLYEALLFGLVALLILPYLLLRARTKGLVLVFSLALLGYLCVLYAWDTYHLGQTAAGLVGTSGTGTTGTAVGMAVSTPQSSYNLDYFVGAIVSQPVAWLGLLGALLVVGELSVRRRGGAPQALAYLTLLAWALVLFVGSRLELTGFPQRFGRDVGVPLAIMGALALVMIVRSLGARRRPAAVLVAGLAVALASSLVGLRAAQSFGQAAGPSPHLVITPKIAAAGEWLRAHNDGGNIMVSPQVNQVPSRMMLAMGHYSALQSFDIIQIQFPRDLPPTGPQPPLDVLEVMNRPAGERTPLLLKKYDVRYIVLYKDMPDRPTFDYWRSFKAHPDLYRTTFENEDVLIVEPREV